MNVTFLNLARDDDWGGGENWTLYTASGLKDRGHVVSIVGRPGSRMIAEAEKRELPFEVVSVGADYAPSTIIRLGAVLRRLRTRVLIVHHNKDVRTGGVAAKLLRIPVIHRNGFPILMNTSRHRFTQKFVSRILTNSHQIKNLYLSWGWLDADRIDVVPNGIAPVSAVSPPENCSKEHLGFPSDCLLAVFAGRLTTVKRADDLVEVFHSLPLESRWRLAVFGVGGEEARLREMVDMYRLDDRVRLCGYRTDVANCLPSADLVLLPSGEEGMPNILMEAMVRAVPVAATPVGDVPHLLDRGASGWLLPVGDIDTWRNHLIDLEVDTEKLHTMGRAGQARILERFTLERMLEGVEDSIARATGKLSEHSNIGDLGI